MVRSGPAGHYRYLGFAQFAAVAGIAGLDPGDGASHRDAVSRLTGRGLQLLANQRWI